jgi:hypothetical protein
MRPEIASAGTQLGLDLYIFLPYVMFSTRIYLQVFKGKTTIYKNVYDADNSDFKR